MCGPTYFLSIYKEKPEPGMYRSGSLHNTEYFGRHFSTQKGYSSEIAEQLVKAIPFLYFKNTR
jgi:hypothetical protein